MCFTSDGTSLAPLIYHHHKQQQQLNNPRRALASLVVFRHITQRLALLPPVLIIICQIIRYKTNLRNPGCPARL